MLVSDFLDGTHTLAEIVTKLSNTNGLTSQAESECLCLLSQGHLSLFKLESKHTRDSVAVFTRTGGKKNPKH